MTIAPNSPVAASPPDTAAWPDAPPRWVRVCPLDVLIPGRGVAALLNPGAVGGPQVQAAVFRTGTGALYAVGNLDPFTGACVVSRGLLGAHDGAPTVASPMLKHVFDLRTGRCVGGPTGPRPEYALPVYPVRCLDGTVEVGAPPPATPADPHAAPADPPATPVDPPATDPAAPASADPATPPGE